MVVVVVAGTLVVVGGIADVEVVGAGPVVDVVGCPVGEGGHAASMAPTAARSIAAGPLTRRPLDLPAAICRAPDLPMGIPPLPWWRQAIPGIIAVM